ncbi:MAG: hypothetical protein HZC17_03015 [Candidatus Omnitrophica bacterium]|nr:hypothetical protein [Candidatus Omnitrophota bacterium]
MLHQTNFDSIQSLVKKTAKFYKPFNLFYGNLITSYLTSWNGKRLITEKLSPGIHVISTGDVDDLKNAKVRRALELVKKNQETTMPQDILPTDWRDLFFHLIQVCKDHEPEKDLKGTICRHDKPVKTVASSLFALGNRGVNYSFFWHLVGNPCQASYRDYTQLTRKVAVLQRAPAATSTA